MTEELVQQRVEDLYNAFGIEFPFYFKVVDARYFPSNRDYAFCHYNEATGTITLGVAPKFFHASMDRQDALLRHELGHAIDFIIPSRQLDKIARQFNRVLSSTPERRADDIAEMVWGSNICYDHELVQTLNCTGNIKLRPSKLGL